MTVESPETEGIEQWVSASQAHKYWDIVTVCFISSEQQKVLEGDETELSVGFLRTLFKPKTESQ